MTVSTNLSYLGIAKETTKGTGVAATDFIPVTKIEGVDVYASLHDNGMRGSMVETYGVVQGVAASTFAFDGDVFLDTIGWPLFGILGDYAKTGAGPYTHTGSVLNNNGGQPTGYSLTDFDAFNSRQFAGQQFEEVAFKFTADGMFNYSAKAQGYPSAIVSNPTPSFGSTLPLPNWRLAVQVNASPVLALVDGEITLKRKLDVIHTAQGSVQAPFRVMVGPLTVTGKATFTLEDESQLLNYLNNSQPSLDFLWSDGASHSLDLHMSKAAYEKGTISRGKTYVEVPIEFEAVANATDVGASAGYSPIKATLINTVSTAKYA